MRKTSRDRSKHVGNGRGEQAQEGVIRTGHDEVIPETSAFLQSVVGLLKVRLPNVY